MLDPITQTVQSCYDALEKQFGKYRAERWVESQLCAAIAMLPKTSQRMFLAQLRRGVGDQVLVTRTNLQTGQAFTIRWDEAGTCVDPSTEKYWSM